MKLFVVIILTWHYWNKQTWTRRINLSNAIPASLKKFSEPNHRLTERRSCNELFQQFQIISISIIKLKWFKNWKNSVKSYFNFKVSRALSRFEIFSTTKKILIFSQNIIKKIIYSFSLPFVSSWLQCKQKKLLKIFFVIINFVEKVKRKPWAANIENILF